MSVSENSGSKRSAWDLVNILLLLGVFGSLAFSAGCWLKVVGIKDQVAGWRCEVGRVVKKTLIAPKTDGRYVDPKMQIIWGYATADEQVILAQFLVPRGEDTYEVSETIRVYRDPSNRDHFLTGRDLDEEQNRMAWWSLLGFAAPVFLSMLGWRMLRRR